MWELFDRYLIRSVALVAALVTTSTSGDPFWSFAFFSKFSQVGAISLK